MYPSVRLTMAASQPHITAPTFEHHRDGFGIGYAKPRLSWTFSDHANTDLKGWRQTSYEVEVNKAGWERPRTYHVTSDRSVLVPWPCQPLTSREMASVRIRCYGQYETQIGQVVEATEWSDWSHLEVGLLKKEDWTATPIASFQKFQPAGDTLRPIRFRKGFSILNIEDVHKARLYITSLGVYEASLNKTKVGDHAMAPGWTSYKHRLKYQTFDVTNHLDSENSLGIEVAEGWYAGRLGFNGGRRYIYGDELAALAQLEVTFKSGEVKTLTTDQTWRCFPSPRTSSEIYDGEVFDLRLGKEQSGWDEKGFLDKAWLEVKMIPSPEAELISSNAPPVRVTEEVGATNIIISPGGKTIIDFGQNLVGAVSITSLHLPLDHKIVLSHAEVLEHGELGTRPLRVAKCMDTVIGAGEVIKDFTPKFTFHGFRYVQVDGWPDTATTGDFKALVMHTDMKRRGYFSCSDQLVNQLHQNVVWSMRGNFLSIPTDCPQRDERLGWTGDIQVFAPTAAFLYDTIGMLSSWLEDVSAEQLAKGNGIPGLVVPDVLPTNMTSVGQAIWHDVTILTPSDLYTYSSDAEILRRQYGSMKAWLDQGVSRQPDGLWHRDNWQLGDWLDPTAPADDPGNGRTDGVLVADAYLVHVTTVFSEICSILDYKKEAAHYAREAAKLKKAFQDRYITPIGLLVNNTQTAISLALRFQLYPGSKQVESAVDSLARAVYASKFHIATGFAGTPVLCHALSESNLTQLAYRMLLEKECPSWLYPVTMGATTIWERWNSMLPDGKINPGEMTSFNHYALGSIASWLHSTVGGISSSDGWRTIKVCPIPGGTINSADVSFAGPYGEVQASWTLVGHSFSLQVHIPPNSRALVTMPSPTVDRASVGSGHHTFTCTYRAKPWPPKSHQIMPGGTNEAE